MRTPDPELHTRRRLAILDAAARVFAEKGLAKATMPDIARAAGMSPANLYHYFPNRDAILASFCEADREMAVQALVSITNAPDFLTGAFDALETYLRSGPDEFIPLALEIHAELSRSPTLRPLHQDAYRDITRRMTDALAMARDRGDLRASLDPHAAAVMILILIDGFFAGRGANPDLDLDRQISELRQLLTLYLTGELAP